MRHRDFDDFFYKNKIAETQVKRRRRWSISLFVFGEQGVFMYARDLFASWLKEMKPQVKMRTFLRYEEIVKTHLLPAFSETKIKKIDEESVSEFTNELYAKELADNSVAQIVGVLKRTLKYAVRKKWLKHNPAVEITVKNGNVIRPALRKAYKEKIIPENPYDFMPTLKKEKRTPTFYDQNDMEKFFEVIKGHHLELAFHMLAFYGLRRSELLGIRWNAIDFINKTITINHKVLNVQGELYLSDTMKTESSCRTLPLIPRMEKELLEHKEKIEKNMQYFGKGYNMKFLDYVFVHENGDLVLPDCMTHNMLKIIRRFNLKPIRLHDLRHSCASIMIRNGVQMKQIQEWLGHSNFSTTADVYSHLDYSSKLESAEKIAAVLDFDGSSEIIVDDRSGGIKPVVPKELEEYHQEKVKGEEIDELFSDLKSQMKTLGFTKLSELFAFLESNNSTSDSPEQKDEPAEM